MVVFRYIIILVVTLCQSHAFWAQDIITTIQHYDVEDGLMHREVKSIYKDTQGFIWLSTPLGLSRFDGYEFKDWRSQENLSLGAIDQIIEDSEGLLWLISADHIAVNQILIFDPINESFIDFNEKYGDGLTFDFNDISEQFLRDAEGTLFFVDNSTKSIVSYNDSLGFRSIKIDVEREIELIDFASDGTIWANYAKIDAGFSTQVEGSIHFQDAIMRIDRSGQIVANYPHQGYISSTSFLLKNDEPLFHVELPKGNGEIYKIDNNGVQLRVTDEMSDILEGQQSKPQFLRFDYIKEAESIFYIEHGDLYIYDSKKNKKISIDELYPQFDIRITLGQRGYFIDRLGRIWLGSDFGLYQLALERSPFRRFLYEELNKQSGEKMGTATRSIAEWNNDILISTEGAGIKRVSINGESISSVKTIEVQGINNWCWGISKLRNNDVYVGSYPYLSKLDLHSGKSEVVPVTTKQDIGIWAIYEDANGLIWLGDNWNGLFTLDPDEGIVRPYKKLNGHNELALSTILSITEDNNNKVWLATSVGLYELDINEGIRTRYWSGGEGIAYLPADNFHHIYHDSDNIYWIATSQHGLIRWDKGNNTYQTFGDHEGLPNSTCYAVYEGSDNHLWISSDYGIIRFNKSSFKVQSYLLEDGITHNEFNRASHYQSKKGIIYFGGLNGVTAFDPKQLGFSNNPINASLQITNFLQFDGQKNQLEDLTANLLTANKIILKPKDRYFQLSYSLLSFEDMNQVSYAYQIEGVDNTWIEGQDNTLRLSRLPYGSFNLRIKGKHPSGQWSQNEISLTLVVTKPFYLSWWFILLALGILLAFIYWIYLFNLRKRLALAEVQRVKDIEALRARLYAYISHEFRTPLTVIMGMAENIVGHEREKHLISRNSKSLLQLIKQLLDLSKVDATAITIKNKQDDIIGYLKYLIQSFYSLAEEKNIRLTFDSEIRTLEMDFDGEKIQQIIYNLISNALKFTNEGGSVMISARRITDKENNNLQIRISDTGIGISESEQDKIFDRFYQVDLETTGGNDTTNSRKVGTGIGLALSKELVDLMGGSISVDSRVGEGSAFTILLPITNLAEKKDSALEQWAPSTEGIAKISTSNGNIAKDKTTEFQGVEVEAFRDKPQLLIIEDNRDVAEYVASCVDDSYHLHFAYDGQQGVDIALSVLPDIIISDVMMPIKDGFEVTRILKGDGRSNHIPIILLTAKSAMGSKIKGLNVGADAYINKPFHKEELVTRLNKLVESRQQLYAHYGKIKAKSQTEVSKLNDNERFVHDIRQYILSRLDDHDLTPSDLSAASHLSHGHMHRKLKALTGKTPAIFIRTIRLEKAKELLKTGSYQVSEVAYKVGFSDPNYFSRIFSSTIGESPSSFIKS